MSSNDEGCPYCYPGECMPSTHEAAVQAEYEAETCKVCGAPPGDFHDIRIHDEHNAANTRSKATDERSQHQAELTAHEADCRPCQEAEPCEIGRDLRVGC